MEKEKALKLVSDLARATSRHTLVANGWRKGKHAAEAEEKAAMKLLAALGHTCQPHELARALNW